MSKPIDQERADFEAFAVQVNESIGEDDDAGCSELRLDRQGGCYVCPETYAAWLAWKARESVKPVGGAVSEEIRRWMMSVSLPDNEWGHRLAAARDELLAAAPHPVSGEQKAQSVQITGHLDEVDAPVWTFINAEARKLGPATGSIDTYNFSRPDGAQPNGVVAVLWNGMSIHALALTVRDSLNRTQCVRLLATPPATQDVAGLVDALTDARQVLATALQATAPDWFKTAADIASHHTIKKIDDALAAHGQQGEQPS